MDNETLLGKINEWKGIISRGAEDPFEATEVKEKLSLIAKEIGNIKLLEDQEEKFEDFLEELKSKVDDALYSDDDDFRGAYDGLLKFMDSDTMKFEVALDDEEPGDDSTGLGGEKEKKEEVDLDVLDTEIQTLAKDTVAALTKLLEDKDTTKLPQEISTKQKELVAAVTRLESSDDNKDLLDKLEKLSGNIDEIQQITGDEESDPSDQKKQLEEIKTELEENFKPAEELTEKPAEKTKDPEDPKPLEQKATESKPQDKSGKEELAGYVPTIDRIKKYFDGEDHVAGLKKILTDYKTTMIGGDTERIRISDKGPKSDFSTLRARLEGVMLPPEGLDLTKRDNIEKAAKEKLDSMLDELKNKESINRHIDDNQRKALEDFIAMRMILGQYQRMDINKDNLIQESLAQIQANEELFKTVPKLDDDTYKEIQSGEKLNKTQMDKIIKQSQEIGKGLYAYKGPSGKPNVLMTSINKANIEKTLDTLGSNSTITWYGKTTSKQRMDMEIATIRRGKIAKFKDGSKVEPGPYSRNMPENPADYVKWFENIAKEEKANLGQHGSKQGWQKAGAPTTKHFIKEVINGDEKMLQAFFQDITLNGSEDLKQQVMKELSSDQRKTLAKSLEGTHLPEESPAIMAQKKLLDSTKQKSELTKSKKKDVGVSVGKVEKKISQPQPGVFN